MMNAVEEYEIPQDIANRDRLPDKERDGSIEVLGCQFVHTPECIAMNAFESRAELLNRPWSFDAGGLRVS